MTTPAAVLCDQAEAYAVGALDDAEARVFEQHLAGCPNCPAVVREFRELALVLAEAAPAAVPPAGLRRRVAGRIAARTPGRAWRPLALAAALAGLVLAGVQTVRLRQVSRALAAAGDTLAVREARVRQLAEQRDAILDDATEMYRMRPTSAATAQRAGAQVFWRKDVQTWLVHAFEMPRLAGGRVYQLWFLENGRAVSAGVMDTDPEGHAIMVVRVPPEMRGATHAAVSVEPRGGSAQPTGPVVLLGGVTAS